MFYDACGCLRWPGIVYSGSRMIDRRTVIRMYVCRVGEQVSVDIRKSEVVEWQLLHVGLWEGGKFLAGSGETAR